MTIIGGPRKIVRAAQPQYVVRASAHTNEYLLLKTNDRGQLHAEWIGDPNAATKFDSRYQAKERTRELENVPDTRLFAEVGG